MAYCTKHAQAFTKESKCSKCDDKEQKETLSIKYDNLLCVVHNKFFDNGTCSKCLAEQKKNPISATLEKIVEKEKTVNIKTTMEKRKEITEHPPHYTQGEIEASDFIEDQKLPWPASNVIKYICRYRYKGDPLGDLYKAKEYLERQIKLIEREE